VDHDNPAEMTGETIAGRYRLLEPLGSGAMSAVWLAHDDELERQVAVKLLAPSADRARFEREARAVAALSHPNICALYDYGEADGKPYMVLEYLPNGSLEERLHAGQPLADDETLRIATELAAGLAHAHERGLVHRDLKPANVLFDAEGRAKIADFGIARMGDGGTLTEAGTVLGTASYISPEQAGGLPAGPASDVYSAGVILFRMLTGAFPFVSTNVMELVRMHRDDPPRPVADARPDAPPRLASIVAASLAKDPADRPPDGAALLRELRGGDEAAAAIDATQVLRPRPAARRRRPPLVPLAAIAAVLLVAGGALATLLTGGGSSNGTSTTTSGLSLPRVPAIGSTSPTTTSATTTRAPATVATTTAATQPVTTAPVTTALPPATTAPALPTTTATPPTTTAAPPVTTAPATTETAPVTTALGTTTTTTP
jgi:eukaryotic-like serine/threonine-protein kinase